MIIRALENNVAGHWHSKLEFLTDSRLQPKVQVFQLKALPESSFGFGNLIRHLDKQN